VTDALERALAAEAAAEEQLKTVPDWMWDGENLPVPVETIADSHFGLLVREEADLAALAGLSGGAHVSGLLFPLEREIWVDAGEAVRAPVRRRFTIGHELGHWVLHCDLGAVAAVGGVVHCREETLREEGAVQVDASGSHLTGLDAYPLPELDANQVAAATLMPRGLVEKEHAQVGGDVKKLARAFGVSTMAMERRLWFLTLAGGLL
jgi:hypothetical protein